MIASIQIADVGRLTGARLLRAQPSAKTTPGLRYAALMATSPLSEQRLPRPTSSRVALFSAWDSEPALDAFLAESPLASALSRDGWRARLQPTHLYGAWPRLDDIVAAETAMSDEEPAAVLTLGRLRLSQTARFLEASAAAERLALADPAMLRSTGMARPPAIVATFSLWSSTAAMRAYANGHAGREHRDAVKAHAAHPFHHQSAFFRFRPYDSAGLWDGVDPLAAQATSATSASAGVSAASSG
jgi:heme-degrading monooxygenase HmoA